LLVRERHTHAGEGTHALDRIVEGLPQLDRTPGGVRAQRLGHVQADLRGLGKDVVPFPGFVLDVRKGQQ
jgi:hypothetical protein